MKINTEKLIAELTQLGSQHLQMADRFHNLSAKQLNWKKDINSWSILECLEHLNLYGDFYLPEIERVIAVSKTEKDLFFKPGIIGNYFVKTIKPKQILNSMKTPEAMNPIYATLDISTIDRFIAQQYKMIDLLKASQQVSLTNEKTRISLVKWLKIRLGDTFRFVVYHNDRHMKQIEKILANLADMNVVD